MRACVLAIFVLGCAGRSAAPVEREPSSAPAPPPPPVSVADAGSADVPATTAELARQLDSMEMGAVGAYAGPSAAFTDAVNGFLRAANGSDDAAARALSTPECWQNECGSFATQAGKKFQARAGKLDHAGERGTAALEVVCDGDRVCDAVTLLMLSVPTGGTPAFAWRVADLTEDEADVRAWLEPNR